jgi:hypothetical protein
MAHTPRDRRKRKDRAPTRVAVVVHLTRPIVEIARGLDGLHDLVFVQLPSRRRGQRGERGVVHGGDEAGGAGKWLI